MSILDAVRGFLEASTESADRGGTGEESKGAYWCHECGERIRDVEVAGETPPDCPDCGAVMAFERSHSATGCAC